MSREARGEKPVGSLNISYFIRHDSHHSLDLSHYVGRERGDVHYHALAILWELRHHSNYLSYDNRERRRGAEVFGPISDLLSRAQGKETMAFPLRDPHENLSLASVGRPGEKTIAIPRVDDEIPIGILSDVVLAILERIKGELLPQPRYRAMNEKRAELTGLSLEEYEQLLLAQQAYHLFIAGYALPHIEDGTIAEDELVKFLQVAPIDGDPIAALREEFGLTLPV